MVSPLQNTEKQPLLLNGEGSGFPFSSLLLYTLAEVELVAFIPYLIPASV